MKINLIAPINSLGYGVAGSNIALELDKGDCEVTLWPIGNVDTDHVVEFQRMVDRQENYSSSAPSIRIWHQNDLAMHVGSGQHIGFPIFELDKFTSVERHHLSCMDALMVCSRWATLWWSAQPGRNEQ